MESGTLEIMVLSAKHLKNVNHLSTMNVYVVVTMSNDPNTKKRTPVAKDGGTNPQWNHPIKFTFIEPYPQLNELFLIFKLICDHSLRGDKDIGVVKVPIKELFDVDDFQSKSPRYVTYQVREPCGKPKGELSFAYKFTGKIAGGIITVIDTPIPAYPAPGVAVPYLQTDAGTYVTLAGYTLPAQGESSASFAAPITEPSQAPIATSRLSTLPEGDPTNIPITGYDHSPLGGYPLPTSVPARYPSPTSEGYLQPMLHPAVYPSHNPEPPAAYPAPAPEPPEGYPAAPAPEPPAGYPVTTPAQYGYPPVVQPQNSTKKTRMALRLGAAVVGGLIGGILIGDMVSHVSTYDDEGYEYDDDFENDAESD